jgi:hypothetical protein
MNKQQLFSTCVVGLLWKNVFKHCLIIVLTYNSWEHFIGSLVIWATLLTFEIFITVIYTVDWIIKEIDNGK